MESPRRSVTSPERGDVLLGWLTKVVIVFAVIGVMAFDGVSLITARLSVQDQAELAARDASITWSTTQDVDQAYKSAVDAAVEANAANEVPATAFTVTRDGTVTMTVKRDAQTFVVRLIPPMRNLTHISSTAVGRSQM
jgi:Flp pilus assembly protein TadG